jgi:hypothetical protein
VARERGREFFLDDSGAVKTPRHLFAHRFSLTWEGNEGDKHAVYYLTDTVNPRFCRMVMMSLIFF